MPGRARLPLEIHDEIAVSKGPLQDWLAASLAKNALVLDLEGDSKTSNNVLESPCTELDRARTGRSQTRPVPYAYGLMGSDRIVVT